MRNPDRIKPLLKKIEDYWIKHPDLRLCQLLNNTAFIGGWDGGYDLFNCEDDVIDKGFESQDRTHVVHYHSLYRGLTALCEEKNPDQYSFTVSFVTCPKCLEKI